MAITRILNITDYGAIGDGTSHPLQEGYSTLAAAQAVYPHATSLQNEIDWAALQKCINLAAVPFPSTAEPNIRGGTIAVPGGIFLFDQIIDATTLNRLGICIRGVGGPGGPGVRSSSGTTFRYVGANAARFIDARSTFGFFLEKLSVYYNSTFTGRLLDFSHKGGGVTSDAERGTLRDVTLTADAGMPAGTGAKCLVSLDNAIDCLFDNVVFGVAQAGVRCREIIANENHYSNGHTFRDCLFQYHRWSIVNAGEGISIENPTIEGSGGVLESFYYDDIPSSRAALGFDLSFHDNVIDRTAGDFGPSGDNIEVGDAISITGTLHNDSTTRHVTSVSPTSIGVDGSPFTTETCSLPSASGTPALIFVPDKRKKWAKVTADCAFTFSGDSITRSDGKSWLEENWQVDLQPSITGTNSNNGQPGPVTYVDDTTLRFGGHTFVSETSRTAEVWIQLGCGPITCSGKWAGDQFLNAPWFEFNAQPGSLVFVNPSFVGGDRLCVFHRGVGGIAVVGGHIVTNLCPFWYGGEGSTGVVTTGITGTGPLDDGPAVPTLNWVSFGNNLTGDPCDRFIYRGADLSMTCKLLITQTQVADDFSNYALRIYQGLVGAIGLGADDDGAKIFTNTGRTKINDSGLPVTVGENGVTPRLGVGCNPNTSAGYGFIQAPGPMEVTPAGEGYILKSPGGTRYKIVVADDGTISSTPA